MRILAASFMTQVAAAATGAYLNRRFPLGGLVEFAELGRAGKPNGPTTVLAGRFADDVIGAVRDAVTERGGTVVVDIDETRTS